MEPERQVGEQVGEHAAAAAHHDRSEDRIVHRTDEHLDAVRDHLLNEDPAQLTAKSCFEIDRRVVNGRGVSQVEADGVAVEILNGWPDCPDGRTACAAAAMVDIASSRRASRPSPAR